MQAHPAIQEAIQSARQGNKREARAILRSIIKEEPGNSTAWYILAHIARTRKEAVFCLRQVIRLDPHNHNARHKMLKWQEPAPKPVTLPPPPQQKPVIKIPVTQEDINNVLLICAGLVTFLFIILLSLGSGTLLAKAYTSSHPAIELTSTPTYPIQQVVFSDTTPEETLVVFEPDTPVPSSTEPALPRQTPTRSVTPTRRPTMTPRYTSTPTRTPTLTQMPLSRLPAQAAISGIYGRSQAYSLDCEARSAVDWAGYFGIKIDEKEFFNRLPVNDNPEKGFSGDVMGYWGMVPPGPYGVYAGPVAELLRAYGAKAVAVKGWQYDQLRREIASGRPVMTWVVGKVWSGEPLEYKANDGSIVTVAKYEHTVILTAYNQTDVTVLDGSSTYKREAWQFQDSWSVLGNMAIVWVH